MRHRLLAAWLIVAPLGAQTTQAILRGRVTDSLTGLSVPSARVRLANAAEQALTDRNGYYSLPLLSPGSYVLEATADNYQPRQVHGVALAVAALVEVDIVLRPLGDVWEQGEYKSLLPVGNRGLAPMFGPDIDRGRTALVRFPSIALAGQDAALSSVISADFLLHLPLAGRDAYSLLVMMPGVTADAGTARGLGVAVNGQRPSASNFLLDGVEHNNYVISAPAASVAPEAIAEYRLSSNNFSAEFGRTSGILANAVTRAGSGNGWHGVAYTYLQNELLNANGFQQNRRGLRRAPLRQWQPGIALGGAARTGTYVSGSLERLRTRTRLNPVEIYMPTTFALRFFPDPTAGRRMLSNYQALLPRSEEELSVPVTMEPPSSLDRWLGLARADRTLGRWRVFGRVVYAGVARSDFLWSPYPDYTAPLRQRTVSPMLSLTHNPRPNWTGEYRVSFSRDRLYWDRPRPEVPTMISADSTVLPGSLAFYSYDNTARHLEVNTGHTWISPRHAWKWGGGVLARSTGGALTAGRDGRYSFQGVGDFLQDWPDRVEAMVVRGSTTAVSAPEYERRYRQNQFHAFAQDAWRVNPRALLSLGARYESFGAPSGGVYSPDRNNFAVRAAVSWRPRARGQTLVKGAYGVFYDRPFDNLWQNVRSNGMQLLDASIGRPRFPILDPLRSALSRLPRRTLQAFPEPLALATGLRDAYVHSAFAGATHRLSENAELEVTGMAALGRALITSDKVGRARAVSTLRGNQGTSSYWGGSATYRHRTPRLSLQASYTWSHSLDVQSESLTGDFFDLSFTRDVSQATRLGVSAFSREADPRGDRGSSDFDQRHNATLFALWQPALLRGWRVGAMGAMRSGFPYTVFAIPHDEGEVFYNLRANYVPGRAAQTSAAVEGGVQRLRLEDFRNPRPGQQGTTSRNGFAGPGFFNVDASVERTFRPWRRMPEGHRLLFRAESYNLLNHANLGTPDNQIGSDAFGVALRGRLGRASSFPAVAPFVESGRQVQLLLRYQF